MENSSVVVSYLFVWGRRSNSGKRGRLPWHQFGALLSWTDLADTRNPFFLGSSRLRGSFWERTGHAESEMILWYGEDFMTLCLYFGSMLRWSFWLFFHKVVVVGSFLLGWAAWLQKSLSVWVLCLLLCNILPTNIISKVKPWAVPLGFSLEVRSIGSLVGLRWSFGSDLVAQMSVYWN